MESSFGVCFYLRKHKHYANGEGHVYIRVTVDGNKADISTKRKCNSKDWDKTAGRLKGKDEESKLFNAYLDTYRQKIFEAKRKLIELDIPLTAEAIKGVLLGNGPRKDKHMLMEVFQKHNDQMKALIGLQYAEGTYERFETSLRHTQAFLRSKYKVDDIDVSKIKFEFIEDYEFWFKTVRKCDHNTTIKYLSNFRKIINRCLRNGWLVQDPFGQFKMSTKEVERYALTELELNAIIEKNFSVERLRLVRDIFLFSCYTGMAYVDISKLKHTDMIIGVDGLKWITYKRQKTDVSSRLPLLPPALKIIERYMEHSQCVPAGKVLPILSNQKMNSYLKEIADSCGIKKNLTFHIARHTFATTVTLSNGVPIETVAKMLGHRSLRTTQHYAKILDSKISADMKNLRLGCNMRD